MNSTKFTLTGDHIKLLRKARVGWQDCEFGAPEIDPKRPYGNSYVVGDIAEILGAGDPSYDNGQVSDHLTAIHRETEMALQIILATGSFTPGTYERQEHTDEWRLMKGQPK